MQLSIIIIISYYLNTIRLDNHHLSPRLGLGLILIYSYADILLCDTNHSILNYIRILMITEVWVLGLAF